MEITNAVRLRVIDDLITELEHFGGENASFRVKSCKMRLLTHIKNAELKREAPSALRHKTMSETTDDQWGQMEEAATA